MHKQCQKGLFAIKTHDSKENSPIWPRFELVLDFCAVVLILQFGEGPSKIKKNISTGQGQIRNSLNIQGHVTLT